MNDRPCLFGLGVAERDGIIRLYFNSLDGNGRFSIDESADGSTFKPIIGTPLFESATGEAVDTRYLRDFRVSSVGEQSYLSFRMMTPVGMRTYAAWSKDGLEWKSSGEIVVRVDDGEPHPVTEPAAVVPGYTYSGKRVMYYGAATIKTAMSEDGVYWTGSDTPVLSPRTTHYDSGPITVAATAVTPAGLLVFYYVRVKTEGGDHWAVGSALFDRKQPEALIFRSDEPVIDDIEGFSGKNACPVGLVVRGDQLLSYWDVANEGIVLVVHSLKSHGKGIGKRIKLTLQKLMHNPILKPIAGHKWESRAVFNPAAIYDRGKVHLLYRASGENDVSVIGYATSSDGVTIDERLDEPVYVPRKGFELSPADNGNGYTSPYFSGGAYGGCEDPRITKLGDRFYMMYVAYNGVSAPRVALTSIHEDDFHNRRWDQWKEPVLVSRPGVVNKNACVLPEKINGKYVVFHRVFPNILVDYVDDINAFDGETKWLEGHHKIPPRFTSWDSRKLGIGAPPIKTEDGWLLIYQAVDDKEANKYKIGAMLLDLENPHKVLYRSRKPILVPDRAYENEGLKYGVAYPCGAVIMDGMLNVYYGGADMVVCAAQAPIGEFLHHLKTDEEPVLYSQIVKGR